MVKQTINLGTAANDGTGTPLRDALDMVNDNFTELYALETVPRTKMSIFDRFQFGINAPWSTQIQNGGAVAAIQTNNLKGGVRLTANSTATSNAALRLNGNTPVPTTTPAKLTIEGRVTFEDALPDATDTYQAFFGFSGQILSPYNHMAMFHLEWTGSAVRFATKTNNTGASQTVVLTTPTVGTAYVLKVEIDPVAGATYWIDGVQVANTAAIHIPTSTGGGLATIQKSLGSGVRRMFVDWVNVEMQGGN